MDTLATWLRDKSVRGLRWSLALVVLWIGALKFVDPTPVIGLLDASLPFLASAAVVYALGVFELAVATMLFFGKGVRIASLLLSGMFGGTLLIFLVAPAVSFGEAGFPLLTLAGEFLIKDVVLLATALTIYAAQPIGREISATVVPIDRAAA